MQDELFEQAEQEQIVRRRPTTQTILTLKEIRQMKYLSKVTIYLSIPYTDTNTCKPE